MNSNFRVILDEVILVARPTFAGRRQVALPYFLEHKCVSAKRSQRSSGVTCSGCGDVARQSQHLDRVSHGVSHFKTFLVLRGKGIIWLQSMM